MPTCRASSFTDTVSPASVALVQWYDHSPSQCLPFAGGVGVRRLVCAVALGGLLFAACGGNTAAGPSPTATQTASAKPTSTESPDAVMARLYEAAKSEGTVAIYSSMNTDDAKKVFPLFEAKFPGVKVQHTRASGEVLTTRVVTEKKAGQDLFDVVESNLFEVGYIIDQGYTQKYVVASAGDYPAEVKGADGSFIAA